MKKTFTLIAIIALLFSLIGCNSDNAPLTGSITVSIKDSVSRTITSDVSPVAVKYAVEGTAPDGTKVSFDLSESTPSWVKAEAAPGEWNFTATAYNNDEKEIGSGTASATVVPGQSTSVTIEVHEYSGDGTLSVNLTGITSDVVTYTATVYQVLNGALNSVRSGNLNNGSITFTLPNGFYSLVLTCDNSSIVMPAAEAVRIMKGDNLSASYSICDQGGVNVVISNGIKPYPEMSVTLDKTSVAVGEEVTATATIQEKDSDGSIIQGSYSYEWYVNNVKLESVDESEATITFDDEGLYNITCIAFNAETGVVWSKVAEVNVVSTVNRVSFYSGNRLIETRNYTPDSSEVFPTLELCEGFTLSGWKAEGSNTLITDKSFSLPYSETEYKYYAYIDTELLMIDNAGAVYGTDSLKNSSTITEVVIPDSITGKAVTSIRYEAFRSCYNLTEITIPDSVTSIGYDAFYVCSSLTSITIPDSVTSIGHDAFSCCSSLTSITIPDSVTSIGSYAFEYCTSLTNINVSDNNKYYKSIDGILFDDNVQTIIVYPCGKSSNYYDIPDSVTSIGSAAFSGCSSLTEITIPEGVTSIGNYAFDGCSSLTSITIPDSVTSIERHAFSGCSSLTCITIPASVTSLGVGAFDGCSSLTSINIPDSVTSIGAEAFVNCTNLSEIRINKPKDSVSGAPWGGNKTLRGPKAFTVIWSDETVVY